MNKSFNLLEKKNYLFFSLRKHGSFGAGGWSNSNDLFKNGSNPEQADKENNLLIKNIELREKKFLMLQNKTYSIKEKMFLKKFQILNNIFSKKIGFEKIYPKNLKLTFHYNWELSIKRRIQNWKTLDNIIGTKFKKYHHYASRDCVPIGYIIYLNNRNKIRDKLKKRGIFTSIHWKLPNEINSYNFSFEKKISNSTLTIPIDQRYGKSEMEYIGETLYNLT